MTRERAIELLKDFQFCCDLDDCTNAWDCDECAEALNMAIEVLERQTCDYCKYSEETDGMTCYECVKGISDNFEALEQVPIVHCKDCKHRENRVFEVDEKGFCTEICLVFGKLIFNEDEFCNYGRKESDEE